MKFSSFFEQKKWMIFCEYSNWQSDEIRRDIFDRLKLSLFDIEQYRLISSNQFFSQTSDIWNKIWFSQLNSFQMDFSSNLINQIWENQFFFFRFSDQIFDHLPRTYFDQCFIWKRIIFFNNSFIQRSSKRNQFFHLSSSINWQIFGKSLLRNVFVLIQFNKRFSRKEIGRKESFIHRWRTTLQKEFSFSNEQICEIVFNLLSMNQSILKSYLSFLEKHFFFSFIPPTNPFFPRVCTNLSFLSITISTIHLINIEQNLFVFIFKYLFIHLWRKREKIFSLPIWLTSTLHIDSFVIIERKISPKIFYSLSQEEKFISNWSNRKMEKSSI